MKNNLYVIYNNLSKRYGDVIASPTDEYCRQVVQRSLTSNQDINLLEYELCRVGSIDVETGVIESFGAPIRIDWLVNLEKNNINVDKISTEVVS